jgi:hypothetical protein
MIGSISLTVILFAKFSAVIGQWLSRAEGVEYRPGLQRPRW